MNEPWVIVGLGNPGRKYENTRHNLGFLTVDHLAERHDINVNRIKFKSLVGTGTIRDQKVILVKPQTYMNLSGEAVREVVNFYKIPPERLVVIYDDFDIPVGSLRIRKSGSAGTHNGMRNIVYLLNTDQFPRIRVGMGGSQKDDLISFVIGGFTKEEVPLLEESIDQAIKAIECMLTRGVDMAMNRYNTKKQKKKKAKNAEPVGDAKTEAPAAPKNSQESEEKGNPVAASDSETKDE